MPFTFRRERIFLWIYKCEKPQSRCRTATKRGTSKRTSEKENCIKVHCNFRMKFSKERGFETWVFNLQFLMYCSSKTLSLKPFPLSFFSCFKVYSDKNLLSDVFFLFKSVSSNIPEDWHCRIGLFYSYRRSFTCVMHFYTYYTLKYSSPKKKCLWPSNRTNVYRL